MMSPASSWHLGLDLAQRRDFTALATLTCEWSIDGRDPVTWEWNRIPRLILRDLERFPVGTEYLFYPEALEERIREIDALTPPYTKRDAVLTVDASGPGGPVVEELRRANLGIETKPLIITGGQEPGATAGGWSTVPRKVLLTNLILLIDHKKLVTHSALKEWPILLEEMLDLNASTTQPNKTTAHDDMVMALAIGAWQATRRHPELLPQRQAARSRWSPTGSLF